MSATAMTSGEKLAAILQQHNVRLTFSPAVGYRVFIDDKQFYTAPQIKKAVDKAYTEYMRQRGLLPTPKRCKNYTSEPRCFRTTRNLDLICDDCRKAGRIPAQ